MKKKFNFGGSILFSFPILLSSLVLVTLVIIAFIIVDKKKQPPEPPQPPTPPAPPAPPQPSAPTQSPAPTQPPDPFINNCDSIAFRDYMRNNDSINVFIYIAFYIDKNVDYEVPYKIKISQYRQLDGPNGSPISSNVYDYNYGDNNPPIQITLNRGEFIFAELDGINANRIKLTYYYLKGFKDKKIELRTVVIGRGFLGTILDYQLEFRIDGSQNDGYVSPTCNTGQCMANNSGFWQLYAPIANQYDENYYVPHPPIDCTK